MPDQPRKTIACPKCHRPVGTDSWNCLYCGEPIPGKGQPKPATTAEINPDEALAHAQAEALLEAARSVCPKCQGGHDRQPLMVETWDYTGSSLTGKHRYYDVRGGEIPGYCSRCSKVLEIRRWVAVALFGLPLIYATYGSVAWGPGFLVIVGILYGGHVLKNICYSWVDRLVYGLELEYHLAGLISQYQPPGGDASVRFPVGFLKGFLRLLFITVLCCISAVVGDLRAAHPVPPAPNSQQEPATVPDSSVNRDGIKDIAGLIRLLDAGNASEALAVVAAHPVLASARGRKNTTALHYAVKLEHPLLIEELLKRGANLEAGDENNHFTPLHWAALQGKVRAAEMLLKKGAKIDARGKHGHTPLHIAILNLKPDAAKFFIERGADLNARVPEGNSCLRFARMKGLNEVAALLQKKGARE